MARSHGSADSMVMKRKANGKCLLSKNQTKKFIDASDEVARDKENANITENGEQMAVRKRPKRAASCSTFKEKNIRLSEKTSVIEVKECRTEEEEKDAVEITKLGAENLLPCRKLIDFVFHDADGKSQPFEVCEIDDIYITALIMPMDDSLEKEKERGVRCEGFGRIESWSISGYDEGTPIVWVITEIAEYECVKPAASYKRFYNHFYEKARICVEVYRKLAKTFGGNPDMSLEELLAGVVRSISGTTASSGSVNRDFVISLGEFIFNQLVGLEDEPNGNNVSLASIPALCALREECRSRGIREKVDGNLKIGERKIIEINEDEDEKLARLLQEEENWKLRQQRGRRPGNSQNIYIKISEAEMANDYPLPAYYKPAVDEMDEYIFFDSDSSIHYVDLPRRVLNNWSLYNSDSRLISLELLPMKPCAETDVLVFGSGNMREDDGSGFCIEVEPGQSSGMWDSTDAEGVPVYLSAIKEWMIEFGSSMIFISIRTDVAWYRLGKPAKPYVPWYEPVLKTAKLAISIITLLKEQTRASKLSFADVIKKVAAFDKENPGYISSNLAAVERYVVVHGQIILQQFAEYPDETIKRCAFVTGLSIKMEERRHTKLLMKKKVVVQKEENLNPSATMRPLMSKRKVMRATTTKLINRIWGEYYSSHFPDDFKEGTENMLKGEEVEEEQEEEHEEDEIEEQNTIVQEIIPRTSPSKRSTKSKSNMKEITWKGVSIGKMDSGEDLYKHAIVHSNMISVGAAVMIDVDQPGEDPAMFFVEFMYEGHDRTKMVHGRMLVKGYQTVLGNAANEREVFLTNDCADFPLGDVKEPVTVNIRSLSWGHQYRKEHSDADKIDRAKADEKKRKGLTVDFFCKCLYWPERGAFFRLPIESLGHGSGVCNSCKQRENTESKFKISSKESFVLNKTEYYVHDFIYVRPQYFAEENEEHETFKASRNIGLRAYVICSIIEIIFSEGARKPTPQSTLIKVRRFYRPEDVSTAKAHSADIREVYYSEDMHDLPIDMIAGKCCVVKRSDIPSLDLPIVVDHVFFCDYSYDPAEGSLKQLPANSKFWTMARRASNSASKRKKGKEKCEGKLVETHMWMNVPKQNRLATLDIFAGCGGLSEGLQQSGATYTKWAIEYEEAAGEAFNKNHPDAHMFIANCNVILRAIMAKCGDADDCISTAEAAELAAKLDEEKLQNLPIPGEVDFINGGPPCQGFSGMNRFSHSTWSKVQCEMILAFLSFAEYFRPRFFLLENVRNFVSFNKGQTFRLTLASLLEMGYQVRFGILEAGAYGVSQSRKRAFIWAASPEETLPEWPEPMHVFAGPELRISLNGDMHYAAARSTADGAPFRSITVRDTIGDLPPVENGASKPILEHGSEPVSWFQKNIRGSSMVLSDHISKEMNELNLIRCKRIPKRPGADWRDLPDEKVKLSNGQLVDLIPWCLPNTALRHNQWKGLFGRLDWEGNFPTSITDPQPMGKVGMCFHPEQDRILTVRECARSQGFRDSYIFAGNIQNKHRQIGNAVPPPLAFALGRQLKEAVDAKHS